MSFAEFHFLRPEWLLALIPAAALIFAAARQTVRGGETDWAGLVDTHLLRHLMVTGAQAGRSRWLITSFAAGLIAAVLAMAGPTWEKQPTPAFQGDEASVVVLSLAQSMNSDDIVPSRLTRATHKLRDILDRAKGEDVALVIYADRPFVAAPLTDDADVIRQMLPELSTSLMPVLGNRLDLAIAEAQGLLDRAGAGAGRIVVLADDTGLDPAASNAAAEAARKAGYSVNVLGFGTKEGARLQTAQGRAITTSSGEDVTMKLDEAELDLLAKSGGGAFAGITADDSDLDTVFPDLGNDLQGIGDASDQNSDTWLDAGYFLLLIPVLLAPLAFRRGLIMALAFGFLSLGGVPSGAQAGTWENLWLTPDQQAQRAYDAGDYADAAALYSSPDAKGAALYREGDFANAAQQFAGEDFNRGNALAKSGAFEEALAAYDAELAQNPQDADAQFNRDLVAKLLEQQKQEDQQQKDQQQDQENQQQDQGGQQDQPNEGNAGQDSSQQDQQAQDQPSDQGAQPQDQAGDTQSEQSQPDGDQSDQQQADAGKPDQGQSGEPGEGEAQGQQSSEQGQSGKPSDTAQEQSDQSGEGDQPSQQAEDSAQNAPDNQQAQSGANNQDQASGNPTEPDAQTAQDGSNGQSPTDTNEQSAFSKLMDQVLGEAADAEQTPQEGEGSARALPKLNQAAEQQLRRVPDDPSGLLRARIRQHYERLRAANSKG